MREDDDMYSIRPHYDMVRVWSLHPFFAKDPQS